MLPIFRTISVGGVLLAITILALALSPPGGSHPQFTSASAPRGALIDPSGHPEWRQFLIQAAIRRADELGRLRNLPDTPTRLPEVPDVAPPYTPPVFPETTSHGTTKIAGLPVDRADADPEETTGSINTGPEATIPIDIGEPSSTELPVTPSEERPPATRLPVTNIPESKSAETGEPARTKSADIVRRKNAPVSHARRQSQTPSAAQSEAPIPFNLLEALFESLLRPPAATTAAKRTAVSAARQRVKPKRPAVVRSVSQ